MIVSKTPLRMSFVGGGVLILLMTVVVPKVTKVFDDMKVTLPWTTRFLIFASNSLQNYWFIFLPVVFTKDSRPAPDTKTI